MKAGLFYSKEVQIIHMLQGEGISQNKLVLATWYKISIMGVTDTRINTNSNFEHSLARHCIATLLTPLRRKKPGKFFLEA